MSTKFTKKSFLTRTAAVFMIAMLLVAAMPATSAFAAIGTPVSVGQATATAAGTTLVVTVPAAGVAAGNTVIITFAMNPSTGAVTAADTRGNVYTNNLDIANGSGTSGVRTVVLSAHVTTALTSGNTITVTSPSAASRAMSVYAVTGLLTASPVDKTASGTGNSTAPLTSATATTAQASELLIGAMGWESRPSSTAFTAGTNYTALTAASANPGGNPNNSITISPEYRIVSATGAYTAGGTLSGAINWAAGIVTFKDNITPTTTTLDTPSAVTYGTAVTFTAHVTPTPTDGVTVNFLDGATVIGSGTTSAGVATYTTTANQLSAIASPHSITATFVGNSSFGASTSTAGSQVVNKKAASVTPNAASKTYAASDPTLAGSLVGFVAADNVTATYSRTAGETVAGGPYTISAVLSPVGVLANYNITYNTASFTINQKAASVTPNAASKTYGASDPTLAGSLVGFVAADNVTATYSRIAGETVAGGPYTISAVLSPVGVLANYNITYNTASFTINQKAASVSPDAASKTYGASDPTLTGSLVGFVAADNVTATYSRTTGETVAGSPYTISAVLSPVGVLANYNITYNTASFTINQKAASVSPDLASKTYGDADPGFTGSLVGFVAADNVTATYSRIAGETVAGGPYTISAVLSPADVLANYNITYNTASFTINQKAASVSPDLASKTYAASDPTLAGSLVGFMAADNVTATYSRIAGETVAGGPYTISAVLSPVDVLANYDITYNTASFTINQKAASVSPDAAGKTYGAGDPTLAGSLVGFMAADNVTATYIRTAGETVVDGPYTISAMLSPADVLANYNITYNTASFTINQKAASVSPDAASKTYGAGDPTLAGSLVGFVAADNVTATYSRTAGETVAGGPYTISAVLSPADVLANYDITYNTASFTIDLKAASVSPDAASKTYGTSDPTLAGSLVGFVAADNVTATYSRIAGETVAGGPYTISAVLSPVDVLANYDITYNTASFTIDLKAVSVNPDAASKTYGTSDPTLAGSLVGFVAADNVTATYSRIAGETVAGGPYTISAVLSPVDVLANYDITYNTASFTIDQKAASVSPDAASKTYGASDPTLTGSLSGFVAADNVTATYSRTLGETVAGGPYTISAVLSPVDVLANYNITYNTASFTIGQKAASVSPDAASKTYGDVEPGFTGSISGFLAADNVTATYSRTLGETVAGGPYTISAVLSPVDVLANYDITYNTASFTINPKGLTVTGITASNKTYDATTTATINSSGATLVGNLDDGNVVLDTGIAAGAFVPNGNVGTLKTVQISGLTLSGSASGNYTLTQPTTTANITALNITVTADAKTKVSGTSDPTLTYSVLPSLFGSDSFTGALTRALGESIGSYPIQLGTLSAGGNYTITFVGANLTITAIPASNVDVYVGGTLQGGYIVAPSQSVLMSYPGMNNGPVKIQSNGGLSIIASQRVAYTPDGGTTWTSFSELMGLPSNQLTTSYVMPWYNNVELNTQLRFGNAGTSGTIVTVTVGGVVQGTYPLAPNQSARVSYPSLNNGPVLVQSSGGVPIIASERVAYYNGSAWTSFSELMGLPANQLTTSYVMPWYNNVDLNTQLRFGNVGATATTVTVKVAGVVQGTYPLAPNQSVRVSYPGLNNGPVQVLSSGSVQIIASERVAYTPDSGVTWTDFLELMGLPAGQLTTSYAMPVYDNANLNTQIRFGNVGSSSTTVTVTVGGVVQGTYPLNPSQSARVSYVGLNSGPIVVSSSGGVPIIASEREAYYNGSAWTSFAEMMGLPSSQMTTSYVMPWYNNVDLNTQMRFGRP